MICGKNIGADFRTSNGLDSPIRIMPNSRTKYAQIRFPIPTPD